MMESALTSQLERRAKLSGRPIQQDDIWGEIQQTTRQCAKRLKTTHKTKSALICYELLVNIPALRSRSSRGGADLLHLFVWVFSLSLEFG